MSAGRRGAAAAVSLLLLSGAVGCAGSGSSAGSGGGSGGEAVDAPPACPRRWARPGPQARFGAEVRRPSPNEAPALPPARSTVIKTGKLSLEVKKDSFGEALDQATEIAGDMGGYVISPIRPQSDRVVADRDPGSGGALRSDHAQVTRWVAPRCARRA